MRIKSLARFLAMLAVISLAVPALAKPISKSMSISQPAKLGNTQLKVGEYKLLIDGNKVTVQRDTEVVAQVEGRWDQRPQKARYNTVVLGPDGAVQEVRFAGDNRVLLISQP
ncbi:MAG TPA: hypothetical protein VKE24_03600 [Candidatus Acidoferrales bacterium]|nr:hypothetical protein [Candidatus Acidoferrales bacterium]